MPSLAPSANTLETINARWPDWLISRATFASWPALRVAVAAECHRIDSHKSKMNAIFERIIPKTAHLGAEFNSWRFNISAPDKPALLAKIFAAGAFASGHYRPMNHIIGGPSAQVAENLDQRVVNLFNDCHTDAAQVEQVAAIVRDHLQNFAQT